MVDRINARFRLARGENAAPNTAVSGAPLAQYGDPFHADMERLSAVINTPEDAEPTAEVVILEVLDTLERSYPARSSRAGNRPRVQGGTEEGGPMPRGDKSAYTDEQIRKAEHIGASFAERGVPKDKAEELAWRTVNKQDGGGKKSGSGRASDTGSARSRSDAAKKGWATRRRKAG